MQCSANEKLALKRLQKLFNIHGYPQFFLQGQIEVEQPLLAPVKDKRLLPMVETNWHDNNLDNNNYVHIALNKRYVFLV